MGTKLEDLVDIRLTSESGSEADNCFNLKPTDAGENTFIGAGETNRIIDQQDNTIDLEENPEETEEKARMICQVLELQNTLEDLSQRVDNVKEENMKLKSENQVLGQYIENLMSNSSVFQSTNAKGKKK